MSATVCFLQVCPTCKRSVTLPVDSLGENVACPYCGDEFISSDLKAHAGLQARSASPRGRANTAGTSDEKPRITCSLLIVERESVFRDALTRKFIECGYDVTAVHHPRQALEAATVRHFHVALIDRTLAEQDGVQLMMKLKRRIAGLQVVLLSRHADPAYERDAYECGAFAYLHTSSPLAEVEEAVKNAFEQSISKKKKSAASSEIKKHEAGSPF